MKNREADDEYWGEFAVQDQEPDLAEYRKHGGAGGMMIAAEGGLTDDVAGGLRVRSTDQEARVRLGAEFSVVSTRMGGLGTCPTITTRRR